jgi:hypothetical protein
VGGGGGLGPYLLWLMIPAGPGFMQFLFGAPLVLLALRDVLRSCYCAATEMRDCIYFDGTLPCVTR